MDGQPLLDGEAKVVDGPSATAAAVPPLSVPGPPPDATARLLPTWWLFVLGAWSPPQQIFWGLIQGIIVPAQVQAIVGDAPGAKQVALGYVATATQLGACWGPCIGTWSDRCNSRLGRRRPFMFFGPFSFCLALFVMQHSGSSLDIFAGGNFLFCFTAAIQCAPFNAILPEIVPASQVRPCTLKYTVPPLLSFISPTCLSAACAWCAQ